MEIAIRGKYILRYKTYIGDKKADMKDIEIVCWGWDEKREIKYCYTIANFVSCKSGNDTIWELKSCIGRLLDSIVDYEDVSHLKELEAIGLGILNSSEVPYEVR